MEPVASTTPTTQQTPAPTPPSPKKDPFSMIGKIAIALIIIVLLVGGGVIVGKNLNKPKGQSEMASEKKIKNTATEKSQTNSVASPTPEPTITSLQTIKGGLGTDATSFKSYSIQIPEEWKSSTEKTEITEKTTLTKDKYSISIYQAPMGGAFCIYPGDEEGNFKQMYKKFKEFTGTNGITYRRSWDEKPGDITYTVCQKGQDGSFGTFTTFGGVTVTAPNPADEQMMAEIDSIILSLKEE